MQAKHSTPAHAPTHSAQTSSDISTQDLLHVLKTLRRNYDLLLHHHFDSPVMGLFNVVSNLLEQLEDGLSTPVAKTAPASVTHDELNQMSWDLGTIRANCITLMHFCEDSFHFNPRAFGELDFNNHDAYLLSSNSIELATQHINRIKEVM